MGRDDAILKLKKLMNMTTERGCTEAEATAAAGLAAKIMMAHDIEASALEIEGAEKPADSPHEIWDDPLDTRGGRLDKWKLRLATVVAHSFGCEVFRRGDSIAIAGKAEHVQVARYVYAYTAREVARLTNERAMGNGRVWVRSYRLGLIDAIRDAIRNEQRAAQEEARRMAASATALVRVNTAIAKTDPAFLYRDTVSFMRKNGFKYTNTRSYSHSDHDARSRGRADGAGIYRGSGGGARQVGAGRKQLT